MFQLRNICIGFFFNCFLHLVFPHLIVLPDVLVFVPVGQVLLKLRCARAHAVHHLDDYLESVVIVADDAVEGRRRDLCVCMYEYVCCHCVCKTVQGKVNMFVLAVENMLSSCF